MLGEDLIASMDFESRVILWRNRVTLEDRNDDWEEPNREGQERGPYRAEDRLCLLGYTWEDHIKDRRYLCDISKIGLETFESYTRYTFPVVECKECGRRCDPEIHESVVCVGNGVRFCYRRVCRDRGRNQIN